jgi:hypothetical protein
MPLALDYLEPFLSRYATLPPSFERWLVFVAFGSLFAVASFLRTLYVKGEYPWLLGKLGGGVISLAFYSYIFVILSGASVGEITQVGGVILLVYVAIGLSYVHLILDFLEARRTKFVR